MKQRSTGAGTARRIFGKVLKVQGKGADSISIATEKGTQMPVKPVFHHTPARFEVSAEGHTLCTFDTRKDAIDYARFTRGFLSDVQIKPAR
jgi:DNA mismatch repair ATPase MutL